MESKKEIHTAGSLYSEVTKLDEFRFEGNNNQITPSLSEFELRKIKDELGMLDSGGEFDNLSQPLPSICVDGNTEQGTPFDFPLTEEERALLEQCTIGSPRRFSDSPSVCSTSLEQLADSLIKDFEDMDSEEEMCFAPKGAESTEEGNASVDRKYSQGQFGLKTSLVQKENLEFDQVNKGVEVSKPSEHNKGNINEPKQGSPKSSEISISHQISRNMDTCSSSASTSSQNGHFSEGTSRSPSIDSDSLPASIDSGLPVKDVHIPQHNYFVVVAIDFGTTFSGYAFSFTRDPESVHMMRRWEGGDPGVTNQKTPTTLLLKPDGSFHSFGFGARDFYHDLEPDDAKKWMYFEKFKMSLHSNKVMLLVLAYSLCKTLIYKIPEIAVYIGLDISFSVCSINSRVLFEISPGSAMQLDSLVVKNQQSMSFRIVLGVLTILFIGKRKHLSRTFQWI